MMAYVLSILVLCAVVPAIAQHEHNMSIGSRLTPLDKASLVSPSGTFAFGFNSVGNNLYYVSIWYHSLPDKTVVWTANRDNPVDDASSLEITNKGFFVLFDSKGHAVWSANKTIAFGVHTATIRDSGNLVLVNGSSHPVWESFDYPTDTLLPSQSLAHRYLVVSSKDARNRSSRRYVLVLQEDGNLVLYPYDRLGIPPAAYWSSRTNGESTGVTFGFARNGTVYLLGGSRKVLWTNQYYEQFSGTSQSFRPGNASYLKRLTLDSDGVLREYAWDDDNRKWSIKWQTNDDPCQVNGVCGVGAYCTLDSNLQTNCSCVLGFRFASTEDWSKGCVRSVPLSCNTSASMLPMDHTTFPEETSYDSFHAQDEDECAEACIDDCQCTAVTFDSNTNCVKFYDLVNGRRAPNISGTTLVRVASASKSTLPPTSRRPYPLVPVPREPRKDYKPYFVSTFVLLGSFLIVMGLAIMLMLYKSSRVRSQFQFEKYEIPGTLMPFSYRELYEATNGFRLCLGVGGSSTVYRGQLPNGRAVAIKKLHTLVAEGEREFKTEVAIIATTHHKNLVHLLGFCSENSHRMLVYEYMDKGSLADCLFQPNNCDVVLTWDQRFHIALGVARGIAYLHDECRSQIIHCDIKPQNILLDNSYNAKVSDFGLAKLMGIDQTRTFTAVRGTRGYLAPEWHKNSMPISVKVDVYGFGTMLLELVAGRKSLDLGAPEQEIILSDWAYLCLRFKRLEELVKSWDDVGNYNVIEGRCSQLQRMVLVALWCIEEDPNARPSMKAVVRVLEGTIDITVPPIPKFISDKYPSTCSRLEDDERSEIAARSHNMCVS